MKEKLRKHLDMLFETAPRTRAAMDLREELLGNMMEKYEDLRAGGMAEEDAYRSVIASLGDVSELIAGLTQESAGAAAERRERNQQKRAKLNAIAVGLYIFGAAVFLAMFSFTDGIRVGGIDMDTLALVVMLLIFIVPIVMQVYASYAYPQYEKTDETMVEEFKEWQSAHTKDRVVRQGICRVIWMLTTVVYFLINYFFHLWSISWVVFLIAGCLDAIVHLIFSIKET